MKFNLNKHWWIVVLAVIGIFFILKGRGFMGAAVQVGTVLYDDFCDGSVDMFSHTWTSSHGTIPTVKEEICTFKLDSNMVFPAPWTTGSYGSGSSELLSVFSFGNDAAITLNNLHITESAGGANRPAGSQSVYYALELKGANGAIAPLIAAGASCNGGECGYTASLSFDGDLSIDVTTGQVKQDGVLIGTRSLSALTPPFKLLFTLSASGTSDATTPPGVAYQLVLGQMTISSSSITGAPAGKVGPIYKYEDGDACTVAADCVGGFCNNNKCSSKAPQADGTVCIGAWECSGGYCNAGKCSSTPDADGDGIQDSSDFCPNTPAGQTIDSNGCSQTQVDTDLDNVCNPGKTSTLCSGSDSCPDTIGTFVNINGCYADGATCTIGTQCAGTYCNAGVCASVPPGLPDSSACTEASQCTGTWCVAGKCASNGNFHFDIKVTNTDTVSIDSRMQSLGSPQTSINSALQTTVGIAQSKTLTPGSVGTWSTSVVDGSAVADGTYSISGTVCGKKGIIETCIPGSGSVTKSGKKVS